MKYLPSAKSPLWQMLFAGHFFAIAYLLVTSGFGLNGSTYPLHIAIPLGVIILVGTFIISTALAIIAVRSHNKTHPKDTLTIFQFAPAELNDGDERLSSVTAKATRNVYLYHNLALPLLAVTFLFVQPSLAIAIVLIGVLTMGHYIAYWIGIKPALKD